MTPAKFRVQYRGLPAEWSVKRLMHLTAPGRPIMYGIVLPGPGVDEGVPIVKSGNCTKARLRLGELQRTSFEIEAGYARSRLAENDVVYSIRGTIGTAALVPAEVAGANVTQDAARIAPGDGVHPRWLLYAVQSETVRAQLQAGVVGATVKGINIRDLKRPLVPVPPFREQRAIADYVDRKTDAIDSLIEKKERLVALLAEKKASAVEAFALKGVHAGPMRDSGIPSVGAIPATWRVQRAKTIFTEFTQRAGSADLELLSVSHITGVTPRREKPDVTMFLAESSADNKVCRVDDLVVNTMWAWMGAVGVTPCDGMVSPSYNVYRLRNPAEFAPRYFDLLLRTSAFIAEMNRHSKGITTSRLRLYPEAFFNMLLPLPPRGDQVAILRAVEALTGGDAAVSARLVKSVEALREYRQALITAAVTGQIDVTAQEAE